MNEFGRHQRIKCLGLGFENKFREQSSEEGITCGLWTVRETSTNFDSHTHTHTHTSFLSLRNTILGKSTSKGQTQTKTNWVIYIMSEIGKWKKSGHLKNWTGTMCINFSLANQKSTIFFFCFGLMYLIVKDLVWVILFILVWLANMTRTWNKKLKHF